MHARKLDCIVIGYNEPPFETYETTVRRYGEDSEAYRDLKFSFVTIAGKPLSYIDLMNHARALAHPASTPQDDLKSGDIPNLAAVYLTHFLRTYGHSADFINLYQYEKDRLASYLAAEPLCVAITTTFYILNLPVIEMIEFIRRHSPSTAIVVGGPLILNHARTMQDETASMAAPGQTGAPATPGGPSGQFEAALRDIGADIYVIESQGELTLSRIVDCLKTGADIDTVPNLAYFREGGLRLTPKIPENNALDEHAIDWSTFAAHDLGPTIQTRTARSCAFSCAFCNYPARAGKLSLASLDTIEHEIESLRELPGVSTLVFIDDTFNVPLDRFKEFCQLLIREAVPPRLVFLFPLQQFG